MTKKHFIALADYLRKPGMMPATIGHTLQTCGIDDLDGTIQARLLTAIADELATFCADQNPRFDKWRWLVYIAGECGPNGGQKR